MRLPKYPFRSNSLGFLGRARSSCSPVSSSPWVSDSTTTSIPGASNVPTGSAKAAPVLLIVQDADIRSLLRFALNQNGFELLEAATLEAGLQLLAPKTISACLLDLDAAGADAVGTLNRLQSQTRVPVLALAGRINSTRLAAALDAGAHDFIKRPFDIEELSARLRAARRIGQRCIEQQRDVAMAAETFRSGSLFVDLTRRLVKVGEKMVGLTALEFSLLSLFIRHAGSVVTHAQILREVWGTEVAGKVNDLRVYLLSLRRKLESPDEPGLFVTERAVGYRLIVREPQAQC